MSKLNVAPTKSNLLSLKRQLVFAEEGYDLLEQKRQILIFELMSRLARAQEVERDVTESLRRAYAGLREATMDSGSENLDRATMGVKQDNDLALSSQRLMGLRIPAVTAQIPSASAAFGVGDTSARAAFVIDKAGVVQYSEQTPTPKDLPNFEAVKATLAKLG